MINLLSILHLCCLKKSLINKIIGISLFLVPLLSAQDLTLLASDLMTFKALKNINQDGLENSLLLRDIKTVSDQQTVLQKILDLINEPAYFYSVPHDGSVIYNKYNTFTFSDDGQYFFDGKKLIESKTGRVYENEKQANHVVKALFTTDGRYIVSKEDKAVKVFNVPHYELIYTIPYDDPNITVSQDNTKLVINDIIYDLATGVQLLVLPNSKLIDNENIIFSATKGLIISSYKTLVDDAMGENPKVGVYNSANGELITTLSGEHARMTPDEKFLVTSYLSTIFIYSTESLECLHTISCGQIIDSFVFDDSNSYFIAFSKVNKKLGYEAYNFYTGEKIYTASKNDNNYEISNNASYIINIQDHPMCGVLKSIEGKRIKAFLKDWFVFCFYFSPRTKYAVACSDQEALLYSIYSKKELVEVKYDYKKKETLVFSPQEDLLITYSQDKILVWNMNPVTVNNSNLEEVLAFLSYEACKQNDLKVNPTILSMICKSENDNLKKIFQRRHKQFKEEKRLLNESIDIYLADYNIQKYEKKRQTLSKKESFFIDLLLNQYQGSTMGRDKNSYSISHQFWTNHYASLLLKTIGSLPYYKSTLPSIVNKPAFSDIEVITQ